MTPKTLLGALVIFFDPDTSRMMFYRKLTSSFQEDIGPHVGTPSTPLGSTVRRATANYHYQMGTKSSESEEYSIIFDETCFNVVISEGSI